MNTSNDGGPAFPCETDANGRSFMASKIDANSRMPYDAITQPGMSLRDWFAGQALAGYLSAGDNRACPMSIAAAGADAIEAWRRKLMEDDVAYVWKLTDAMIAARNKPSNQ